MMTESAPPSAEGPRALYEKRVAAGDIAPDPVQRAAVDVLEGLHDALKGRRKSGWLSRLLGRRAEAPAGLYLHGPVGRGKSMLMDIFTDTSPLPVKRQHFHAFMQDVHARLHEWRQMDARERRAVGFKGDDPVPPLARALADDLGVLCLDELEITDIADAMIVGRLFAGLLDNGVVMLVTSNRHPRDLYQGGLNRQLFEPFIALILERFRFVRLDAERDYRINGGDMPRYMTPLSAETRARMDAVFRTLTGGAAAPDSVTVKGRTLHVPAAAGRVARFSFADLCARPLGTGDYLALARCYDTILMDDIPRLGRENRNEARRFVTFIDVAYDEGLAFICSAADLPEQLYTAGDGQAEFGRTVSRLHEMAARPAL